MDILLIGATGFFGPHVVKELAPHHRLRITDVRPAPPEMREQFPDHQYFDLDVTSQEQVMEGADGVDAIVNLSVVRHHPVLAFQVNALGCYHIMKAAVEHGIRRMVNTGPHFTVAGPSYEHFDFRINPDVPPQPGTGLYPITKSLGHEVCRVFTEHHDVYVQDLLLYSLREEDELTAGAGGVPFVVTWADAAQAVRLALEIDLARLPSKCEVFFIFGDIPQQRFLNDKAKRILGFQPEGDVAVLWKRPGAAEG